jgi:hypothetical protein
MKTNLPESITSVEEATRFLTELFNNNEAYHPEDDAFDIVWQSVNPTEAEKRQLNKLMNQIYDLPEAWSPQNPNGFDPCAVLMDLIYQKNA